jgi:hypothetical protein
MSLRCYFVNRDLDKSNYEWVSVDETNLDESIKSSNFGEAQKHIIGGVLALIVFFIIILTPQVIELINIASTNYDDDISYDADLDDESDSPCYAGEKYDEKDCFNETKYNLIIATILQILLYAIPVYGLIEIHRGVTKLFAGLRLQNNILIQSTELESRLDEDESDILVEYAKNRAEQFRIQDGKSKEQLELELNKRLENKLELSEIIKVILVILLFSASWYLISRM